MPPDSTVLYAPYGEIRSGVQSELTDFGYTGQRLDSASGGLMYYGARYYLPGLRRFVSADTVVPSAVNGQALNRYSYVFNNPLKYVDPSGHVPMIDGIGTVEGIKNNPCAVPGACGGGNGGSGGDADPAPTPDPDPTPGGSSSSDPTQETITAGQLTFDFMFYGGGLIFGFNNNYKPYLYYTVGVGIWTEPGIPMDWDDGRSFLYDVVSGLVALVGFPDLPFFDVNVGTTTMYGSDNPEDFLGHSTGHDRDSMVLYTEDITTSVNNPELTYTTRLVHTPSACDSCESMTYAGEIYVGMYWDQIRENMGKPPFPWPWRE